MLRTRIDETMDLIEEMKKITLEDLAKKLKWDLAGVEKLCKILEKRDIVEIRYPISIFEKPTVILKNPIKKSKSEEKSEGLVESYRIVSDFVPADVLIYKQKGRQRPSYKIVPPVIGPYTGILLDYIKEDIGKLVQVEVQEITDKEKSIEVKRRFFEVGKKGLQETLQNLGEEELEVLAGTLLHVTYGLGNLELLMADDNLEEIAVNSSKVPIAVYHKKYGWLESNLRMKNEEEIANYSMQIGRKAGRQITLLNPILDAHLISGDRVYSTLFPVSTTGNTITIRRFSRNPWTTVNFIDKTMRTLSIEMAALLWQAVHYELNIIIAGGTASGKTSMLNTLCSLIPLYQRIITIEDTRELSLPNFVWNWVPLLTRNPNPEGLGEVSMLDLLIASLRMRPDRIILGEIRRKSEAEVLFEAMHTGHAVYSTMHADTSAQALKRLIEPPFEIPMIELESLHLIVVQYRDRRTNIRRTLEISEIVPGIGEEKLGMNHIYSWRARTDKFEKLKEPERLYDVLNLHTGMTQKEVNEDLKDRQTILEWMLKNKIYNIDEVGEIMARYYNNPEEVIKESKKSK